MALDPAFGSFDIGKGSPNLSVLESFEDTLLVDSKYDQRIQRDGQILARSLLEGREIRLQGTVGGSTDAIARTNLQALIAALHDGQQNLQIFDDRILPCRLDGSISYKPIGNGFLVYEWRCRLKSEVPFWGKVTNNNDSGNWAGAGPFTEAFPDNTGDAPAPPVVTMTLQSVSVTNKTLKLSNLSTNQEVRLHAFDWNQFDTITFNFGTRLIVDGSGNPIFAGTIEGDWWELAPGIISMGIEHDLGAGGSINFTTTYQEKFYSL